jgi:hypothetical protein
LSYSAAIVRNLLGVVMSRPMSNAELNKLMEHIAKANNPFKYSLNGLPPIKYVHPNYDNRTGYWFSITLRTMGGMETVFHTQNECRDLKESLYERVMAYLTTVIS